MSGRDVLLLGGGGFIGTALIHRLTAEGRKVHVLGPHAHGLPGDVHFLQGSLDSSELLADVLPYCGTVIHLASASTPGSSAEHPVRELENLVPTLRLLEVMQAHPGIHLIFFSSGGTLYGNPHRLPVHEDDPAIPCSYHGAGKAAIEAFLHVFCTRGHKVTILRPSNAYGPGQRLKAGFGVIRTMLGHLQHGTPMEIWGDGGTVRDYIYIDDLVDACLQVLHTATSGTFNVGCGEGHSVNELCRLAEAVTGRRLELQYRPARAGDVRAVVLDISRIRRETGWEPQVELAEGLSRTWAEMLRGA